MIFSLSRSFQTDDNNSIFIHIRSPNYYCRNLSGQVYKHVSSIGSGAGVGVVVVVGGLSVEKQVRDSNQSEASLGSRDRSLGQ